METSELLYTGHDMLINTEKKLNHKLLDITLVGNDTQECTLFDKKLYKRTRRSSILRKRKWINIMT